MKPLKENQFRILEKSSLAALQAQFLSQVSMNLHVNRFAYTQEL